MSKVFTGGSVIHALLEDDVLSAEFKIRGITRDTSKPSAQDLAGMGVEVIEADMNSKSSLSDAIKGSHTVFLVTTPDFAGKESQELVHGKNVADVAKE
ncbi:unnamed protein product [Clonostachys rosea]|uniref:NmrA-like domain-containing protein n=1 Tax=Bionectria ochroleuca TaxID=29856 RepID=A0ABY6UKU5_BIOOC|nr:unnamed protein product [Clonostachys rosea]